MSREQYGFNTTGTGKIAERLAAEYLKSKGMKVLEYNYRYKRCELDLIASEDELLVFIEVKYRSNSRYGFPEEFVSGEKLERLRTAAEHYMEEKKWEKDIRFDIVSVVEREGKVVFEHFRDCI